MDHNYSQKDLLLTWAFVALLGIMVGLGMGARLVTDDHGDLVQCQEDEVWYPEDFVGTSKGGNDPEDLRCLHVDDIDWDRE
jgi:hypothetical protein